MGIRVYCTYCSKEKDTRPGDLPAFERYRSPRIAYVYDLACREGLPCFFLSGEYGLISAQTPIPWYDHLLTADEAPALARVVAGQIRAAGIGVVVFFSRPVTPGSALGPYHAVVAEACRLTAASLEVRMMGGTRLDWREITRRAAQAGELLRRDRAAGERAFTDVLALAPDDPMIYYQRGLAYSAIGRYQQAAQDLSRAEAGFPRADYQAKAHTALLEAQSKLAGPPPPLPPVGRATTVAASGPQCPACLRDVAPTARYCPYCGTPLQAAGGALSPGQTMNGGQYRVTGSLGKGGMGAIYLAQNTQAFDRRCVIKEMLAYYDAGGETRALRRFEQEARTLAALRHPGIPDIYGFFSEHGRHYIVMQYIEGDNLETLLEQAQRAGAGALPEQTVLPAAIQVCEVLECLAQQPEPVVHCDIKPANIIVEKGSGRAVLVDFGTARADGQTGYRPLTRKASVYGTVGYAAPELYQGTATPASDVFSLGATMYHLLTGDDPSAHPFYWPEMDTLPSLLARVIRLTLETSPALRESASSLRHQLSHYLGTTPAPSPTPVQPATPNHVATGGAGPRPAPALTGKYAPLGRHLSSCRSRLVTLTYQEMERILGFALPASAGQYRPWWGNSGHSQARAWLDAGWKVDEVDLGHWVRFVRVR